MVVSEIFVRLLLVSILAFTVNIPLGMWRYKTRKFSLPWFLLIHLAVPLIYLVRLELGLASWTILVLIKFSILGQLTGGRIRKKMSENSAILSKQS